MRYPLFNRLALDSGSSFGLPAECSRAIPLGENNAVQLEVLVFAFSATTLTFQLQGSLDEDNWSNIGSTQSMNAVGRKILNAETAVAAAFLRVKAEVTAGKAIVTVVAHVSKQ